MILFLHDRYRGNLLLYSYWKFMLGFFQGEMRVFGIKSLLDNGLETFKSCWKCVYVNRYKILFYRNTSSNIVFTVIITASCIRRFSLNMSVFLTECSVFKNTSQTILSTKKVLWVGHTVYIFHLGNSSNWTTQFFLPDN